MKHATKLMLGLFFQSVAFAAAAGQCEVLKASGIRLIESSLKEVRITGTPEKSCFAAYLPKGKSIFRLGFFLNGTLSRELPTTYIDDKEWMAELRDTEALKILLVSFFDLDNNGTQDVLLYGYQFGNQYPYNFVHIYWSCPRGYVFDRDASDSVLLRTLTREGFTKSGTRPADVERIARSSHFKNGCQ